MAEYLIKGTTLTSIADAIREKTGTPEAMKTVDFPDKIRSIATGGGIDFDSSDENLKYFTYQLDTKNKEVILMTHMTNTRYQETNSNNIYVAGYSGGYQTVVKGLGNNGFFANSVSNNITIEQGVRFFDNTMRNTFRNCINLNSLINIPNSVVNMDHTFYNCTNFNQPVTIPNSVVKMNYTFASCTNFNQPVTIPNSVVNMFGIFDSCSHFNQTVTIPNSVVNMFGMFYGCYNMNQPVVIPNGVQDIRSAFNRCYSFNQPITIPSSVIDMTSAFNICYNMNQPVVIQNGVQNMYSAFNGCKSFNQPITIPESVKNTSYAFSNCFNFNQPITISNGTVYVSGTLFNCSNYNQPITIPESVTYANAMLSNCKSFGSDIMIFAKNINGVFNFLGSKNNSLRVNIYVPPNCTTNTKFYQSSSSTSILGATVSWTIDNTNKCYYNATRNVYVYYTVGT